jgi:hypothetical protein
MWEIREKNRDRDYRSMRHDEKSVEEAYECGYEDGWEDAMKEMEDGEKSYRMSSRSYRSRKY